MSFIELENFYSRNIDLYLNLANTLAFNGWPLGLEAVKNGSALLTTDPDNVSKYYNAGDFGIYPLVGWRAFIKEIRRCEKNPIYLQHLKVKHNEFVEYFAGYGNQQERIFNFIDSRAKEGPVR
jgi:hypothetical protein